MQSVFPSVSVIVPTYGRPGFLLGAIESVLQQTLKPHEIIIVDDCSPVDLSATIKQVDSTISYHRLPENRGANFARNYGVRVATGELVAFLDDDDEWFIDKLERQSALLQSRSDAEACLCGWRKQKKAGGGNHRRNERVHPFSEVRPEHLLRGNVICGMSGLVARREVMLAEQFDEVLPNGQDWDMYIRLSMRAPIAYVSAALFMYRFGLHDSISLANTTETLEHTKTRLLVLDKHRAWMGEKNYRDRLAVYILRFVLKRPDRLQVIRYSLFRAGILATLKDLWGKASERIGIT